MTQTQTHALTASAETTTARPKWPLFGAAAGLLGYVATLVLDGRTTSKAVLSDKLFDDLSPVVYRMSMIIGYVVVGLLLVFAANWRRRIEPRVPGSTAAHLVPLGLVASAAGLTDGYGWKGALGDYIPGGMDHGQFDSNGLYVYYLLADFGAFIGWLGVIIAACAVIWMSLRERTVAKWIGVFSIFPVLGTIVMVVGMGVPGIPGMFAPLWLLVTGLGLTFGRSTITR
jgi:hypothetical protein